MRHLHADGTGNGVAADGDIASRNIVIGPSIAARLGRTVIRPGCGLVVLHCKYVIFRRVTVVGYIVIIAACAVFRIPSRERKFGATIFPIFGAVIEDIITAVTLNQSITTGVGQIDQSSIQSLGLLARRVVISRTADDYRVGMIALSGRQGIMTMIAAQIISTGLMDDINRRIA